MGLLAKPELGAVCPLALSAHENVLGAVKEASHEGYLELFKINGWMSCK